MSEKKGDTRKPEPDDPIDTSDSDEAEREFVNFAEPEKELVGDDDDEQDGAA